MRYTLLKMVELILSSMDSDEVNSISDTAEISDQSCRTGSQTGVNTAPVATTLVL